MSVSGGLTGGVSGEQTDCNPKSLREHSDIAYNTLIHIQKIPEK